jgi:hypothetical protein
MEEANTTSSGRHRHPFNNHFLLVFLCLFLFTRMIVGWRDGRYKLTAICHVEKMGKMKKDEEEKGINKNNPGNYGAKRAAVMISFCLYNTLDKVIWDKSGDVVYDWHGLMYWRRGGPLLGCWSCCVLFLNFLFPAVSAASSLQICVEPIRFA